MATITKTVKSSGGDYTSLAAWDAGEAQNLTDGGGDIAVADVYAFSDTAALSLSGSWVTSAGSYISIVVHAGERHAGKWDATKYRLEITGSTAIAVTAAYVRFDGLQIKITGSSGGYLGFYCPAGAGDIRITNCIVRFAVSGSFQPVGIQTGDAANVKLNNCIFYSDSANLGYIGIYQGSSGTLYAENCLVYGFSYGAYGASGTETHKNVGILECTTPTLGTIGETTCSTTTPTFVDEANGDFHLDAADTTWIDAGTDLSADGGWVLGAVDIDGETRSGDWDIGPDEYVSASESHSGSSAVSGKGTIAGAGIKAATQAAVTSGAGALVALGLTGMLGLASVSGGGANAATGYKAASFPSAISGGGALAAIGEITVSLAAITGNGSLATAGTKGSASIALISGGGSLASVGTAGSIEQEAAPEGEPVVYNDHHYLPFLTADGVSAFSQELKALHEGSFAASSGSITFINALQAGGDHFFDKLHGELTWINRPIRVLLGGPDFTYADFRAVFTGLVARHVCNDENFSVDLVDPREGIHRDLPVNHFWPSEYPGIADADSMKEVPMLYGAITGATPTKIGTNIYKYHDGRCKGLTAVTHNGTTLSAGTHYFDDPATGILTFVSTFTIADGDIITVDFEGRMSDDNVLLTNGALLFKDVMNEFLGLTDADLDLDTLWETQAAKTAVLAAPLFVTRDSQRFIRDLEVSLGSFTSQDAEGRIGLKALTTTAPSSAIRVSDHQLFGLESEKARDALSYSAVEILYAQDPQAQLWERVKRTSVVLAAKYGAVKTLTLETYLTTEADAIAVADAILAGLEAGRVTFPVGSVAFGVQPGDLIIYSRARFFDEQGTAVEKTLRVLKADKNVATRQTVIQAEVV